MFATPGSPWGTVGIITSGNDMHLYDLIKTSINLKSQLNPYDLSWASTGAAG